jgi:hypothetical protein
LSVPKSAVENFERIIDLHEKGGIMSVSKASKMSTDKKCGPVPDKDYDYPDKTTGSEAAEKTRKEANKWTESKRSELFERGMQVIYGGSGFKKKIRSRH